MHKNVLSLVLAGMLAGCAAPQPTPVTPSNDNHASAQRRDAGWVSIGIGSAAAAVALGTGYVMLHDKSVRSSACNAQNQCTQEGLDANSQIQSMQNWNTAAWIVALVGGGVGAFLVLTNPAESKDEKAPPKGQTTVGVTPNGSGMTLGLGRSF